MSIDIPKKPFDGRNKAYNRSLLQTLQERNENRGQSQLVVRSIDKKEGRNSQLVSPSYLEQSDYRNHKKINSFRKVGVNNYDGPSYHSNMTKENLVKLLSQKFERKFQTQIDNDPDVVKIINSQISQFVHSNTMQMSAVNQLENVIQQKIDLADNRLQSKRTTKLQNFSNENFRKSQYPNKKVQIIERLNQKKNTIFSNSALGQTSLRALDISSATHNIPTSDLTEYIRTKREDTEQLYRSVDPGKSEMLIKEFKAGQSMVQIQPQLAAATTLPEIKNVVVKDYEPSYILQRKTRNSTLHGTENHTKYKKPTDEFQDKQLMQRLQRQYLEEQMKIKNDNKIKENENKKRDLIKVNMGYEEHIRQQELLRKQKEMFRLQELQIRKEEIQIANKNQTMDKNVKYSSEIQYINEVKMRELREANREYFEQQKKRDMVKMVASENTGLAMMKQKKTKLENESKMIAHKMEMIQANEYAKLKAQMRVEWLKEQDKKHATTQQISPKNDV